MGQQPPTPPREQQQRLPEELLRGCDHGSKRVVGEAASGPEEVQRRRGEGRLSRLFLRRPCRPAAARRRSATLFLWWVRLFGPVGRWPGVRGVVQGRGRRGVREGAPVEAGVGVAPKRR